MDAYTDGNDVKIQFREVLTPEQMVRLDEHSRHLLRPKDPVVHVDTATGETYTKEKPWPRHTLPTREMVADNCERMGLPVPLWIEVPGLGTISWEN